jgi:hypothetical protein
VGAQFDVGGDAHRAPRPDIRHTSPWRLDGSILARLGDRLVELAATYAASAPLRGDSGRQELARARRLATPLLERVVASFAVHCPPGFPAIEDNGIDGPGGSIGVRFSRWHAFFLALEREPKPRAARPAPGEREDDDPPRKRLPGEPLPPPDPETSLELVTLSLRWDEARGWVEVRRALPAGWDEVMLEEHLAAYLVGLSYDLASGAAGATDTQGAGSFAGPSSAGGDAGNVR